MDEKHFWAALARRIGREFFGMPERKYRYFWCDGLLPDEYLLTGPSPAICGSAWISRGDRQAPWPFRLVLPRTYGSFDEIDWAELLPPDDTTAWMTWDEEQRWIELAPGSAVPDEEARDARP